MPAGVPAGEPAGQVGTDGSFQHPLLQGKGCPSGSDREIPVVLLDFYPLDPADGSRIDPALTGIDDMTVAAAQENVDRGTVGMIELLREGSRYRGAGEPSLDVCVLEIHDIFTPIPLSGNCVPWNCPDGQGKAWYRPDYRMLLSKEACESSTDIEGTGYSCGSGIDVCEYADGRGVKEIWVWGYHGGATEPVESDMSMGTLSREHWNYETYGDVSNSERIDDLPICSHTYTLYNFNYARVDAAGQSVHNQMHQFEAVFGWLDDDLFWNSYVGPYQSYGGENTEETFFRCGSCHVPPNGATDYDFGNEHYVWTDCFDWTPEGSGGKEYVSCEKWNCREHDYDMLWMQSIPGAGNTLVSGGRHLRNWWDFIFDLDEALKLGKSLVLE